MTRPRGRCAPDEPSWVLRVPFMLVMAALVSCLLSVIERPSTRARCGPEAVRVRGVEHADVDRLHRGLSDLSGRVGRLRRALSNGDVVLFERERAAFDGAVPGWEPWPDLRAGGDVSLDDSGGLLRGWPETTAAAFGLARLDPVRDRALLRARLDLAASSIRGLASALLRGVDRTDA